MSEDAQRKMTWDELLAEMIRFRDLYLAEKAKCEQLEPTFGGALEALKEGRRVMRLGWNGKGMFIYMVRGWTHSTPAHVVPGDNAMAPFIAMKTADDKIVPWVASQTDVLAEDWREA